MSAERFRKFAGSCPHRSPTRAQRGAAGWMDCVSTRACASTAQQAHDHITRTQTGILILILVVILVLFVILILVVIFILVVLVFGGRCWTGANREVGYGQ